jgi:hypothetical protein
VSDAEETESGSAGCLPLALGAAILLALSLMPPVLGPIMAPRLLPVLGEVICPADSVAAETRILASRGRRGKGTSYSWIFRCEQRSGVVERAPEARTNVTAWVLFNSVLIGAIVGSVLGYRALDRRVRPRTTP